MADSVSYTSRPSSYHERPPTEIDTLIRYLEVKGRGTWREFDIAAKEVVIGLRNSYELGARLAAHSFLDFDWRDSSWQFGPTTLVEGREGRLAMKTLGKSSTPKRWHVYGASSRTVTKLCDLCAVASAKTFVDLDLPRNRMVARFIRHALPVDYPPDIIDGEWLPELVFREDLEAMFEALPNVRNSGDAFVDESPSESADTLRAAAQTQKFNSATNSWVDKHFDESIGFWRVDSTIKRYFNVSIVKNYAFRQWDQRSVGTRVHIARVSPELGRWMCSLNPGSASVDAAEEAITITLSRAVFDLPVLHERWLTLWGCQRKNIDANGSLSIRFDRLRPSMARKLLSLLTLREV